MTLPPPVKLLSRLRQIAMVGGVETFGVAIGGIAGLLIVNVMPKDQYAAYTFLVACMTLILGMTDLGLAHCCLPIVGQRAGEVPWVVGAASRCSASAGCCWRWGSRSWGPTGSIRSQQHGWSGGGYLLASAADGVGRAADAEGALRQHGAADPEPHLRP